MKHFKRVSYSGGSEIQKAKGLQHLQPRSIISMYKHFISYDIYLLSLYISKPTEANSSVYATC